MKKSQVSMELFFAVGSILIIFLIILLIWSDKKNEIKKTEDYINERDTCLRFANYITEVFINGEGTKINITSDYSSLIQANIRNLYIQNKTPCTFPIDAVKSDQGETTFYLDKGIISLENINNTVIIKHIS